MQPPKSGKTNTETRRAWEPPAVTRLAIGTETRSPAANAQSQPSDSSVAGQAVFAETPPPAEPKAKFGFYFEMAFPLSARWGS
jgi:hypothetical protein